MSTIGLLLFLFAWIVITARFTLSIGSRSILFGIHAFYLHPFFVALGWWKLYGFPRDPRLWVAFFVHDLGYWGKPNMDGPEGEQHPYLGARIMQILFDHKSWTTPAPGFHPLCISPWWNFTLYHSRFLAKKHLRRHSKLCCADKLAFVIEPRWFYLLRSNLSGEIHEYMRGQGCRTPALGRNQWQWLTQCQNYIRSWVEEHKDCKPDTWSGTVLDNARQEEKCFH